MSTNPAPAVEQSVRSAWTFALRNEVLRTPRKEVARIAQVGLWLSTYGDPDGSSCRPGTPTLAALCGGSEATVGRALRVLKAVGLITGRRGPNKNTEYQLLMPVGPVDWDAHLHLYTDNRQSRHRQARKQAEIRDFLAERGADPEPPGTPSGDAFRNPSPPVVPEPVPAGGSEEVRNPSPDGAGTGPRTGSGTRPQWGGNHETPTYGRDQYPDQDMAEPPPQPPTARASPLSLAPPRNGPPPAPAAAVQPPLMLPVPDDHPAQREPDTPPASAGLDDFRRTRANLQPPPWQNRRTS